MSFTISRLNLAEIDDLFEFRKRAFPVNWKQLDRDRWNWLFRDNPLVKSDIPVWVLKNHANKIVGCVGSIPLPIRVGKKEVICSFGCDYFVDRGYLGLPALRLLKTMESRYPVNIGANLSTSAKRLFTKMGYFDLSKDVLRLVFEFPRSKKGKRLLILIGKHVLVKMSNTVIRKRFLVKVTNKLPRETEFLWEKSINHARVSIVKNYNYLRWRYEWCPSINYKFIVVRDRKRNERLVGLAAVFVWEECSGDKFGVISDILIARDNRLATYSLLVGCLDFFNTERCSSCATYLLHSELLPYFKYMGFKAQPSDLGLMVLLPKNGQESLLNLTDPDKWAFWLGDTDRY